MDILRLKPEQRLSQTRFRILPPLGNKDQALNYTCPICTKTTKIKTSDFITNCRYKRSNLGVFYQRRFDQKLQSEKTKKDHYWDFYCPGCSPPVRIVYTLRDGARDACYLRCSQVLEAPPPPFPGEETLCLRLKKTTELFHSLSLGQDYSCYPYLWLAGLILSSLEYDHSSEIAISFFEEKQKLDLVLSSVIAWEGTDGSLPVLFHGQFFLWLAMLFKNRKCVDTAIGEAIKISDLFVQYGLEKEPGLFFLALSLVLGDFSVEELLSRLEPIVFLKKNLTIQENLGSLWGPLLISILGRLPDSQGYLEHIHQINQLLDAKRFTFWEKDLSLGSIFLGLGGKSPQVSVERFIKLGEAMGKSTEEKKASLSDPTFLPDEHHPFREVILSLINEFPPTFPFDSIGFLPLAILSNLPWKDEDLAREGLKFYSYLRSYRHFASPGVSLWVATGLIFSAWESGEFPDISLFWMLTGLAILAEHQLQEEFSRNMFSPQI